jgi:Zn-finger nucleic acid-binding protein
MICPGCGAAMTTTTLHDRLGTALEIDVCAACHAFWFDRYENIRLSAASTLRLFDLMAAQDGAGRPLAQPMKCPRCHSHLALTHDMQQRATTFEYWRCPHAHGHFITFLQFLKEKDFVRPLTPRQIADLRESVQTINCSNCGGPIDLARQTLCPHCGSPLTMLDVKQIANHVRELREADAASRPASAAAPTDAEQEAARQFAAAVAALAHEPKGQSLLQAGLRQLGRWLAE